MGAMCYSKVTKERFLILSIERKTCMEAIELYFGTTVNILI